MSLKWMSNPIFCEGKVVCVAINPNEPLLPLLSQIIFRAKLLYNGWQAYACDGRQMSYEDFDRMESFEGRLSDTSLNERALRKIVDDFGEFIPGFITTSPIHVPERALLWTQRDTN